ncbi:MAG: hypothetical protein AB1720_03855 [Pseudomonadota bacterium]
MSATSEMTGNRPLRAMAGAADEIEDQIVPPGWRLPGLLGGNYGLVFTAFGASSLAPMLGAWSFDATGGYGPALVTAGGLAGLGLVLCGYMMTRGTGGDEPHG